LREIIPHYLDRLAQYLEIFSPRTTDAKDEAFKMNRRRDEGTFGSFPSGTVLTFNNM
jgi:hypothetical protein